MRRSHKLLAMAGALALTLPAATSAPARAVPVDGEPGTGTSVGLGNMYYPFSPAPGVNAAFPHMALIDAANAAGQRVPQVWLGFSQGPDSVTNPVPPGLLVSRDGGNSFTERRDDAVLNAEPLAMIRRSNGEIVVPRFMPDWNGTGPVIVTRVSADRGQTWTTRSAAVTPPPGKTFTTNGFDKGMRVHKGAMELPDGRLIVGAYGKFAEDAKWSSFLLTSTDGGASWSVWGVINADNSVGSSEVAFSRTKDGRLIAVLRGAPESIGLLQSYSSDDGRTWTTPTKLVAPTPTVTGAVEPSLVLQPNGVLVLAYGRPGNHLLVSASGNGDDWGGYRLLQNNVPAKNSEPTWGSSANMTMVSLDSSRSLVAGDTCAPWGCQPYNETYAIWARHVDAVGPGTGKIDLRTLVAQGKAKITAETVADPGFEQTNLTGMVDGSADVHAATRVKAGSSIVVELDKPYLIDTVGLLLRPGVKQSANVQLSENGKAWGKPEVKAHDRLGYALGYDKIQPTLARFIKISPDGAGFDQVTELELFSADTYTFENDPVNQAPRGWVQNSLAEVVDVVPSNGEVRTPGYQSRRALRLLDFATDDMARATLVFGQRQAVTVSYQMMGVNRQTGTLVTVNGVDAAGKTVNTWHFNIDLISGNVRQYDGKAWQPIGTATPMAPGAWRPVTITADTTKATIAIGGQSFVAKAPNGAATSLSSLTFASSGTAPKGSSIYFDDVQVR